MTITLSASALQQLRKLRYQWAPLALGLLLTACEKSQSSLEEALAVQVVIAQQTTNPATSAAYSGVVVPRLQSELAFRVAGKIIERPVDIGTPVETQQLLMRLDPMPYQLAFDEAKAQLAQERHTLARSEREVARNRRLVESDAISGTNFDTLVTDQARAKARVQAAQSRLDQARDNLAHTSLSVPADATVVAIHAEIGQVVAEGKAVLMVAYAGQREVEIEVPEAQIAKVAMGMAARVTLLSSPGNELRGTVREVAPMATPASRTFRVRVALEQLPEDARLGMTAQVRIQDATTPPTFELPITSLFQQGEHPAVWVLPKHTSQLQLRPVQLAELGTTYIRVSAGLLPGEQVVISGVHKLDEKQKVKVWDERLP